MKSSRDPVTPLLLCLTAGLATYRAAATNPSFHILGSEQYAFSANALSGDGMRIVGVYQVPPSTNYETVYADWRTSLTPIVLQPGARLSPYAVSYDGSVIIGNAFTGLTQPFRFVNGTLSYITPPVGRFGAMCYDVSGDGNSMVGQAYQPGIGDSGVLWNINSGWTYLPHLSSSACANASATAISGNGQKIAGSAHHCGDHGTTIEYEAVAWNPAIAGLGWSENVFATAAEKVSADGSTIVGQRLVSIGGGYMSPLEYTPCRWTSAGIEYLAPSLIDSYACANDVSANGNVIVGGYGQHAFVWFADTGFFDLNDYAASLVGSLDGWELAYAIAISDDGTIILGAARRNGHQTAFILNMGSPCIADYNHDGIADFFDYLEFLQDFSGGNLAADVNHDLVLDFFDYLDFVQVWSDGC